MNTNDFYKLVVIITIIIISFFGCENKTMEYEYTMYENGYIRFWRDSIHEKYKKYLEKGDFLINTTKGDTLIAGKYQNGFKYGKWKYHPNDTETVIVNWKRYYADDHSIEINYPKEWNIIKSNKRPFQATFPTKSNIKKDKYFVVLSHKKSNLDKNLYEYWMYLNTITHLNDSITSHLLRKFSRKDGDFYFSTYSLIRNNEKIFIFNFLGETNSIIYDITYASLKEDINKKYIIFLDMIRSLKIENKRFFTPFEQSTRIIELKWPPERKIIS